MRTGLLALGVCAALASGAAVRAARRQAQDAPGSSQATSVEPRSEHVGGGVFNVFFDIASLDPAAVFTVWLEVSLDGGRTFDFRPQSVSGDIGPNVRPGKGKRIVWNAARDVERLEIEQFRFRVLVSAPPKSAGTRLRVVSVPAGAEVTVDGSPRGATPLDLTDLKPGSHRVTLKKSGFLENSREVQVVDGATQTVDVGLTALPGSTSTGTIPQAPAKKGSPLKWVLPLAGGGAAAGVLAASAGKGSDGGTSTTTTTVPPTNRPPVTSGVKVSPDNEIGLQSLTVFTFQAQGVSDPDGDQVTVTWDFGDGQVASGLSATHTYPTPGTFSVRATATDTKGASATASASVRVMNMNGAWANTFQGQVRTWALTQTGTHLDGTYTNTGLAGVVVTASGSISSPRTIDVTTLPDPRIDQVRVLGSVSTDGTYFEGLVTGGGAAGQTLRFVKQ